MARLFTLGNISDGAIRGPDSIEPSVLCFFMAMSRFPGASTPGSVLAEPKRYTAFTRFHTL
jgi:hypothetical protein